MPTNRWLLAGLGNPGSQYENTRHNIGFRVIHQLAETFGIAAQQEKKWNAMAGTGFIGETPVVLVQPLTYMNCSGESISKILHYYQIPLDQLLIIYDDCALSFGKIRVRSQGSAGGHNGMKSIIQMLGGESNFPRLRVGIGSPQVLTLHNHVLSRFSTEEEAFISASLLGQCTNCIQTMLTQGIEVAMTQYNQKEKVEKPLST